jgi:hypothetical protein
MTKTVRQAIWGPAGGVSGAQLQAQTRRGEITEILDEDDRVLEETDIGDGILVGEWNDGSIRALGEADAVHRKICSRGDAFVDLFRDRKNFVVFGKDCFRTEGELPIELELSRLHQL